MPTELDQLLQEGGRPPRQLDVDDLWVRGRRRRAVRRVAGATSMIAVSALLAVGITNLAPLLGTGQGELAPVGEDEAPDEAPAEEPDGDPDGELPGDHARDDVRDEVQDGVDDEAPAVSADSGSPEPDPDALADPCATHADRQMESFIAVVSPVEDQLVDGEVELVGCANVYEATVQHRLLDGDGTLVAESFTTATCGSGCVGEFHETIPIPGAGTWTIQTFTESAEDGSEQQLGEITFRAG